METLSCPIRNRLRADAARSSHGGAGTILSCRGTTIWFMLAEKPTEGGTMPFYIFYVIAITILVLHFTGWLKRNNLEWIVLVLAVATFPAVIFLR
jgi:hypothetical protein